MRFCRRYRCCSNVRQGRPAHSSLGLVSGALVSSMRLALLHSTISGLCQHILDITPSIGFSDYPSKQMHAVGTCSCLSSHMRVICWLLRSDSSFFVAVGSCSPPGFVGVNTDHLRIVGPYPYPFWTKPRICLRDICVNSFWLVRCN